MPERVDCPLCDRENGNEVFVSDTPHISPPIQWGEISPIADTFARRRVVPRRLPNRRLPHKRFSQWMRCPLCFGHGEIRKDLYTAFLLIDSDPQLLPDYDTISALRKLFNQRKAHD